MCLANIFSFMFRPNLKSKTKMATNETLSTSAEASSSSSSSSPPPSITFKATTNKVSPIKMTRDPLSLRDGIMSHDSLREQQVKLVQYSVATATATTKTKKTKHKDTMITCDWGLVSVILEAYNHHHNLILRPDDVWQAILTQFSLYLLNYAEELRDKIVDFQGKKQLMVSAAGTLFTVDFSKMASRMVDEQIVKNIKNAEMVEWLLPSFSTTTEKDRIAASVCVMSAMQKYFDYKCFLTCGIPHVTLMGTPEDWMALRNKIDGLLEFEIPGNTHIQTWHGWLSYIGDNLVKSSKGEADINFWDRVASRYGGGSGPSYISGWISAFAVWSESGEWQGVTEMDDGDGRIYTNDFPVIDSSDLPSGVVSVPVLVDDNGVEYDCMMYAGQFGFEVATTKVQIAPRTDWCIVMPEKE